MSASGKLYKFGPSDSPQTTRFVTFHPVPSEEPKTISYDDYKKVGLQMLGIFSASFMILFVRSIKNKMLIVCQTGILKLIFVHWNDGATELIKKGMWVGGGGDDGLGKSYQYITTRSRTSK